MHRALGRVVSCHMGIGFLCCARAIASEQFVERGATASYSKNQLHDMVFA